MRWFFFLLLFLIFVLLLLALLLVCVSRMQIRLIKFTKLDWFWLLCIHVLACVFYMSLKKRNPYIHCMVSVHQQRHQSKWCSNTRKSLGKLIFIDCSWMSFTIFSVHVPIKYSPNKIFAVLMQKKKIGHIFNYLDIINATSHLINNRFSSIYDVLY